MSSDIKKTPVPIKALKSTFDDLVAKLSASVGRTPIPDKPKLTPVPIKGKIPVPIRRRKTIEYRERVSGPPCEICTAKITSLFVARCGHGTWLCPTCRRDCEAAMEWCEKCDAKRTVKQLAALEKACEYELNDG